MDVSERPKAPTLAELRAMTDTELRIERTNTTDRVVRITADLAANRAGPAPERDKEWERGALYALTRNQQTLANIGNITAERRPTADRIVAAVRALVKADADGVRAAALDLRTALREFDEARYAG